MSWAFQMSVIFVRSIVVPTTDFIREERQVKPA